MVAVIFIVEVGWLKVVLGVEGKLFGLPRLLVTENSLLAYASTRLLYVVIAYVKNNVYADGFSAYKSSCFQPA